MAQKTLGPGTARTGSEKSHQATPAVDGVTPAEVFGTVPQTENPAPPARREYPEVNAAIERGLADIAAGRVHTRRSYAEYADIETQD